VDDLIALLSLTFRAFDLLHLMPIHPCSSAHGVVEREEAGPFTTLTGNVQDPLRRRESPWVNF
jgi:hypothetical protein